MAILGECHPASGAAYGSARSLSYLSFERLHGIHATVVERGLTTDASQRLLIAGLPPVVTLSLPRAPTAGTRILKTLLYLNGIEPCSNGMIPLEIWLRNAEKLLRRFPEQEVIRTALDELHHSSATAEGDLPLESVPQSHGLESQAAPSRVGGSVFKPAYLDSSAKVLSRKLERLYAVTAGQEHEAKDAVQVSEEIDKVTRRLREAGRLQPGDFLADGRFQLLARIGEGRLAAVWKVRNQATGEIVAAKVLHSELGDAERVRRQFLRGARSMQKLSHPHIVQIKLENGAGEYDSKLFFYYFVMELLAGGNLQTARLSHAIDRERGLAVIGQMAQALQFAHDHDVVHGNLTPSNILFGEDGTAKLTDLDLLLEQDVLKAAGGERDVVFSAPEAVKGQATFQSDVYSLAMTAVFVMHGKPLPESVPLDRRAFFRALPCSESTRRVLMKATEIQAAKRFQSVEEFLRELRRTCEDKSGKQPAYCAQTPDAPAVAALPPGDTQPPSRRLGKRTAVAAMAIGAALAFAWTICMLLFADRPGPPIEGVQQGAAAVPSAGPSTEAAVGAQAPQLAPLADTVASQGDAGVQAGGTPK